MIDFHSHLVPGVDDGASDLDESRAALETMREQGVKRLVTTPHLKGSLTENPEELAEFMSGLDAAWERLRKMVAAEFPDMSVDRGLEVMLDTPAPDISDERIRLAGTSYVLVEFPYMTVPPNSVPAIFELKMKGWTPVIAHPERYTGVDPELRIVEEWRRVGGRLQVNYGSLLGRYGGSAQSTAWRLLRRGWVDYLGSDYHARGRCAIAEACEKLRERGGEEQLHLLTEVNPERLLAGQSPLEVPPLRGKPRSLWRRLFGSSRR